MDWPLGVCFVHFNNFHGGFSFGLSSMSKVIIGQLASPITTNYFPIDISSLSRSFAYWLGKRSDPVVTLSNCLTAGSRDAAEDLKMQCNGRYWSYRPHQRPQTPNGSGALALIGGSSSSIFLLEISSLGKSLWHWLLQCAGENSSDSQKISYGMS
jgi:hypothetical protein